MLLPPLGPGSDSQPPPTSRSTRPPQPRGAARPAPRRRPPAGSRLQPSAALLRLSLSIAHPGSAGPGDTLGREPAQPGCCHRSHRTGRGPREAEGRGPFGAAWGGRRGAGQRPCARGAAIPLPCHLLGKGCQVGPACQHGLPWGATQAIPSVKRKTRRRHLTPHAWGARRTPERHPPPGRVEAQREPAASLVTLPRHRVWPPAPGGSHC